MWEKTFSSVQTPIAKTELHIVLDTFRNVLFQHEISDLRKIALKITALLPEEGVSRSLLFNSLVDNIMNMKQEIINLELEGYVKKNQAEQDNGDFINITRVHSMIRDVILHSFFETEIDLKPFLQALDNVIKHEKLSVKEIRDLFGIIFVIVKTLKFNEFSNAKLILNNYKNFVNDNVKHFEKHEINNICTAIDYKINYIMNDNTAKPVNSWNEL